MATKLAATDEHNDELLADGEDENLGDADADDDDEDRLDDEPSTEGMEGVLGPVPFT